MKSSRKVRYAVVGLGHIAEVAVLPAFRHAKKYSLLSAVVTGDASKGRKLAKLSEENIYGYHEYDELLHSGRIDAVYICLPNHLHEDFATRALQAGIHVLCEKPMALTVDEAERMKRAAEKNNALLMTAYRVHFEPANLEVLNLCRKNHFGKIRYFSSDFSFTVEDKQNIRLRSETGGGPLWDIGIYCINAARTLFGTEPYQVTAFAESAEGDSRFNEVEEMASAVLRFPDERLATFTVSFGATSIGKYRLIGTKGIAELDNAYEYAEKRVLRVYKNDKLVKTKSFPKIDQFAPEIEHLSECILKGRRPEPSVDEGLADVRVIAALYESIERGQPIQLDSWSKTPKSVRHQRHFFTGTGAGPAI